MSDAWFNVTGPEADDGLELGPHALAWGSWDLSLPAVDGRVPPPADEGRPQRWLGEPEALSVFGETDEEPHAFVADEVDLLPQLRVPLSGKEIDRHNSIKQSQPGSGQKRFVIGVSWNSLITCERAKKRE